MVGDRDTVVVDAVQPSLELGELVIMGGEEGLRPNDLRDVLDHGPGDAEAVEGRGTAADLVEDQQRLRRRIPEDIRHLVHLHHEGRLPGREVVACADPREDTVADRDVRTARRHEGADARHQHDQRHLPHISRFTGHVRSGDDGDPVRRIVEAGIIGHEHPILEQLLDDRMPPVLDVDAARLVDLRPAVVVARCDLRKRNQAVEQRHIVRGLLHTLHVLRDGIPYIAEKLILELVQLLLRAEDLVLKLLELLRRVALRPRQGLLPDIVRRHEVLEAVRHLDAVAEDAVKLHLQRLDARALPLPLLELREPLLAVQLRLHVAVRLRVVALADDAAIAARHRRILHDCLVDPLVELLHLVDALVDLLHERGPEEPELLPDVREHTERLLEGDEIPRVRRLIADLSEQTLEIVDGVQVLRHLLPVDIVPAELLDGVLPREDLRPVDERLLEKAPEHTRAHRGPGLVEDPEQRAALFLLPHRLDELEVPLGRGVDDHVLAACVVADVRDMRDGVLLRLIDIVQRRRGTQAREVPVREADPLDTCMEMLLEQLRRRLILVHPVLELRDDQIEAVLDEIRVRARDHKRLIAHDLRRLEAAQLVEHLLHRTAGRRQELTGRHIDAADAEARRIVEDAHEEVVLRLIEPLLGGQCSRCHHADDPPLHESLRKLRILELLRDGHLVARAHEPRHVAVRRMKRDAAHRSPLRLSAVLPGQHQVQHRRSGLRILIEHLVEIADAIKEDAIRILLFGFEVLRHHRRQLFFSHLFPFAACCPQAILFSIPPAAEANAHICLPPVTVETSLSQGVARRTAVGSHT